MIVKSYLAYEAVKVVASIVMVMTVVSSSLVPAFANVTPLSTGVAFKVYLFKQYASVVTTVS